MDGLKESALRWELLGYFLETMFSYIGECVFFFFFFFFCGGLGRGGVAGVAFCNLPENFIIHSLQT